MTRTLELIFDFASPNVYLAYRALPPILERTGARLVINPCLLGGVFKLTGNQAPITAFANVKGKLAYESLEIRRFVARHRLGKFRMNPHFPVISLLAMRGLVALQGEDTLDRYIEATLAAFWEDGIKMDDPAVFAATLDKAGLDGAAILARTQDPAVKQTLADNTQGAVERGVFGAPTFFVAGEMFFGKDRLGQVEEELARQRA